MHSEEVNRAVAVGDLRIEVDDALVDAGGTAVVPGRVTNLSDQPVRVVLLAQGFPREWCPSPQVLLLSEKKTANVFVYLTPPPGTPVGRYLWSLTAQTAQHPMQAATAELTVRRPQPDPVRASPKSRRRPWLVALTVLAVLVGAVSVAQLVREPGQAVRSELQHAQTREEPREETWMEAPSVKPAPMEIRGEIQAEGVQNPDRVTLEVTALTLAGISDLGHLHPRRAVPRPVTVRGKHWTTRVTPGLYAMKFSREGHESQTILVDTGVIDPQNPPRVRLPTEDQEPGDDQRQEQPGHQ
ncbi:COG1470 family protein [Kineosporia babensis]|uniref:Uncharacterized protein n=1 Tax=Kineosporia babensis TaxID=499548 RepID=A0A9X1NB24_9ACTN|nr:hypothetical protein [Kineosporia babensis]MCD5310440.1 hypothetical protein [Kineosporia babensis]